MFIIDHDGDYRHYDGVNPRIVQALPAGAYTAGVGQNILFFRPVPTTADTLVRLDTRTARSVGREIDTFFDPATTGQLMAAGLKHRRGVLLHGAAGSGKTSLLRAFFPSMIERNAVILVQPHCSYLKDTFIPSIRRHDQDRPIVIIWDEFEMVVSDYMAELLQLLDGVTSPEHLMVLTTSNQMAAIPDTLVKRPSRFGLICEMPPLDGDARMAYTAKKYPMLSATVRQQLISLVDPSLTLDYVEEACKLFLMKYEYDEIRDRMTGIKQAVELCYEDDELYEEEE